MGCTYSKPPQDNSPPSWTIHQVEAPSKVITEQPKAFPPTPWRRLAPTIAFMLDSSMGSSAAGSNVVSTLPATSGSSAAGSKLSATSGALSVISGECSVDGSKAVGSSVVGTSAASSTAGSYVSKK